MLAKQEMETKDLEVSLIDSLALSSPRVSTLHKLCLMQARTSLHRTVGFLISHWVTYLFDNLL